MSALYRVRPLPRARWVLLSEKYVADAKDRGWEVEKFVPAADLAAASRALAEASIALDEVGCQLEASRAHRASIAANERAREVLVSPEPDPED